MLADVFEALDEPELAERAYRAAPAGAGGRAGSGLPRRGDSLRLRQVPAGKRTRAATRPSTPSSARPTSQWEVPAGLRGRRLYARADSGLIAGAPPSERGRRRPSGRPASSLPPAARGAPRARHCERVAVENDEVGQVAGRSSRRALVSREPGGVDVVAASACSTATACSGCQPGRSSKSSEAEDAGAMPSSGSSPRSGRPSRWRAARPRRGAIEKA